MNSTAEPKARKSDVGCDLSLSCTTPKFDQHKMLRRIAEDHQLEVERNESCSFVRIAYVNVTCVLSASAERFVVAFNHKPGSQYAQCLAAAHLHGLLGSLADEIVGDWHLKFDYGWRDPDLAEINIDDFPTDTSFAQVVQNFCRA